MATFIDQSAAFIHKKEEDTYKYTPFQDESSQIRLLTLYPGEFSEVKIHLDLRIEQLTTERWPKYEALSYAWGSTADLVDVFIGTTTEYKIAVTRNLECALRHLRYPDKQRVLWVDAICVNQKDLRERGHQVKRMANLFTMAYRVVVWLGPEENNSSMAVQTLESLASKIEVSYLDWKMWPSSSEASDSHWADQNIDPPFNDEQWLAISEFLGRTWFERLWTWQEIRLANSDAIILCGHNIMLWQTFRKAAYCLYAKPHPERFQEVMAIKTRAMNICDAHGFFRFGELSYQTRYCKCMDLRDRVYALISMVNTVQSLGIEPDYTRSFQEVYENLFVKTTMRTLNLDLLGACELQNSSEGMPTWVANWSKPRDTREFIFARAASFIMANFCYPAPGVLRVSGLQVTTIHQVEMTRITREKQRLEEAVNEVERLALQFNVNIDNVEAFYHAICMNLFSDSYIPPAQHVPDKQKLSTALHEMRKAQQNGQFKFPEYLYDYLKTIKAQLVRRCFFVTHDGRFGVGPPCAETNDLICVLLGCEVPMILRPTENGQFQIVGGAYCNGLMAGEALLGPLPANVKLALKLNAESTGYNWTFVDRDSKNTQPDDPRIGTMPESLELAETSDGSPSPMFINDQEGAKTTHIDPRFTTQGWLRERGVDLRDFDLV